MKRYRAFVEIDMAKGDYSCEKEIFKLKALDIDWRHMEAKFRAVEESTKYSSPLAKRAADIITIDRVMSWPYAFE
jgi:hypothetical protein